MHQRSRCTGHGSANEPHSTAGTIVLVAQMGTGQATLAAASGVAVRTASSRTSRAQYSEVSVRKIGTGEWLAAGDLT